MVLGIRSPWASAWVTEDLHHDMGDTRLHRGLLGMAIVPGIANGDRANVIMEMALVIASVATMVIIIVAMMIGLVASNRNYSNGDCNRSCFKLGMVVVNVTMVVVLVIIMTFVTLLDTIVANSRES